MDCNILNKYRPVSNLTFLSKVIEKAVAFHLNKYLINNNLNESLQSAYKTGHSTETALVRVKNDIMMSIDQGKPVILVLLDLSAARLKNMFGLAGKYSNGLDPIWNNAPRECLFIVFYLTFSFYYLAYHRVQFFVLCFSQCIPVLLGSMRSRLPLMSQ